MSVENLKEYARRCASDPELRTRAKEIGVSDVEEHMRHAGSLGLDWTMDDMFAFRKEVVDAEGDQDLSEEELEQVAGGALTVSAVALGVVVGAAVAGGVVAGSASAAAVGGGVTAATGGGW